MPKSGRLSAAVWHQQEEGRINVCGGTVRPSKEQSVDILFVMTVFHLYAEHLQWGPKVLRVFYCTR